MQDRIKSAAEQQVQQRTGRDDIPAYLRELFVDRRWTDREVADHFGVHRVTVTNWRKEWGITPDERQAATA